MKILSLNLGVEKTGSSLLGAQKLVGNQKCKSLPGVLRYLNASGRCYLKQQGASLHLFSWQTLIGKW